MAIRREFIQKTALITDNENIKKTYKRSEITHVLNFISINNPATPVLCSVGNGSDTRESRDDI